MRIDAHHASSGQYPLEHLESILNRNRFEGSIFVGPPAPTPGFVRGIVVPAEHWSEECLRHPKVRGVQVGPGCDLPGEPAELRLPVDVMGALGDVPWLAERYPHLAVVIDHLGAPAGEDWPRLIEDAARRPNVYCKLSGLTRLGEPRPYVQHALRLFGPGRLMFGSDWPNALPEHTWKANLAMFTQAIGAQNMETREQLLGGTAARVYGI